MLQVGNNKIVRYLFETKVLGTGEDRSRKFERISRCKDKFDKLRRLFECLEQSIECLSGKHVNFIDDEDLVAGRAGLVFGVFDQLFDIIDPAVTGGIHLDDIHVAVLCRHDAVCARTTGV